MDFKNITKDVKKAVAKSRIKNGIAVLFSKHTTAGLSLLEDERGHLKDLKKFLKRLAPQNGKYHHNEIMKDDNGCSHIQTSLIGQNLTVPLLKGKLALGRWQSIILADLDVAGRQRRVLGQVMGE